LSGYVAMKMVAEYLEHAINFERMAADEKNPQIKATFEKQTATYRKLLAERDKLGLDDPRCLASEECHPGQQGWRRAAGSGNLRPASAFW
jgi:hypothetical protein